MDLKGDLSGIAESGEVKPFILERLGKIGLDFQPQAFPTELLTISEQKVCVCVLLYQNLALCYFHAS